MRHETLDEVRPFGDRRQVGLCPPAPTLPFQHLAAVRHPRRPAVPLPEISARKARHGLQVQAATGLDRVVDMREVKGAGRPLDDAPVKRVFAAHDAKDTQPDVPIGLQPRVRPAVDTGGARLGYAHPSGPRQAKRSGVKPQRKRPFGIPCPTITRTEDADVSADCPARDVGRELDIEPQRPEEAAGHGDGTHRNLVRREGIALLGTKTLDSEICVAADKPVGTGRRTRRCVVQPHGQVNRNGLPVPTHDAIPFRNNGRLQPIRTHVGARVTFNQLESVQPHGRLRRRVRREPNAGAHAVDPLPPRRRHAKQPRMPPPAGSGRDGNGVRLVNARGIERLAGGLVLEVPRAHREDSRAARCVGARREGERVFPPRLKAHLVEPQHAARMMGVSHAQGLHAECRIARNDLLWHEGELGSAGLDGNRARERHCRTAQFKRAVEHQIVARRHRRADSGSDEEARARRLSVNDKVVRLASGDELCSRARQIKIREQPLAAAQANALARRRISRLDIQPSQPTVLQVKPHAETADRRRADGRLPPRRGHATQEMRHAVLVEDEEAHRRLDASACRRRKPGGRLVIARRFAHLVRLAKRANRLLGRRREPVCRRLALAERQQGEGHLRGIP